MKTNLSLTDAIKSYEDSIKPGEQIFLDTLWHQFFTEKMYELLVNQQNILQKMDLSIECLEKYLMRARSKSFLLRNIKSNYHSFIRLVEYLKEEKVPIEERIYNSLGKNSKYGID